MVEEKATALNDVRPNNEADLICEALVREIARGGRWMAVVDAWQALLTVRRMEGNMTAERKHIAGAAIGQGMVGGHHRA